MERKGDVNKDGTNYEMNTASEWKIVPNKGHRSVVRNKAIPRFNQYSYTPDSGSSAIYNRLDNKNKGLRSGTAKPKVRKIASKPAVVTITGKPEGASYADILNKAKQKVSLGNLGIDNVRMRRAMNGALVIELPGPDGQRLASTLRNTLEEVLKDEAKLIIQLQQERSG